jgi:Fur family ferric uptake transcriptional regulator
MPNARVLPAAKAAADLRLSYSDRATDALRANGLRITRPRRSIIELLERASAPLTAAAIHEALRKRRIVIDLASVYRTVSALEARELIHRLQSVEGVVRCEPGFEASRCHHHLVCERCGAAREIACDGLEPQRARVEKATGFHITRHQLEFVGLCAACASARPVANGGTPPARP